VPCLAYTINPVSHESSFSVRVDVLAGLFLPTTGARIVITGIVQPAGRGVKRMSVDLRPGESQESLLKRFRKAVAEARILPIVRQKRWFTSKSEVRRIKKQKAIRKAQRTVPRVL